MNMEYDLTSQAQIDTNKFSVLCQSSAPKPLEFELVAYPNQVGGHGVFGGKCGILQSKITGMVYKPVQRFPKGIHEVELYERVFAPDCHDEVTLELRQFIPRYQGVFYEPKTNVHYFCMKDLLSPLINPSICDIKMGQITYTPDSSPSKVRSEQSKYKWQEELGFSITGLRLSDLTTTNGTVYLDRNYGRSLNLVSVYDFGIRQFLGHDVPRARRLASLFVARLRRLAQWFEKQQLFAFYSSSLLLAYGNPPPRASTAGTDACETSASDEENVVPVEYEYEEDGPIIAHLIDFTRWCELSGQHQRRDENLLYGLYKLLALFERAASETRPLPAIPSDHLFVHG